MSGDQLSPPRPSELPFLQKPREIKHRIHEKLHKQNELDTICAAHRIAYKIARDKLPDGRHRDDLMSLLEVAYDMAKRMHFKLEAYKNGKPG